MYSNARAPIIWHCGRLKVDVNDGRSNGARRWARAERTNEGPRRLPAVRQAARAGILKARGRKTAAACGPSPWRRHIAAGFSLLIIRRWRRYTQNNYTHLTRPNWNLSEIAKRENGPPMAATAIPKSRVSAVLETAHVVTRKILSHNSTEVCNGKLSTHDPLSIPQRYRCSLTKSTFSPPFRWSSARYDLELRFRSKTWLVRDHKIARITLLEVHLLLLSWGHQI